MPRNRQGSGRHDNPSLYGAFYCSRDSVSCIAEALQPFRGQTLSEQDLKREGNRILALAAFELSDRVALVDLDDPSQLDGRKLRPSVVATADRRRTQSLAARIYEENAAGFLWWSTLESMWINCTLFRERTRSSLELSGDPVVLSFNDPSFIEAAGRIGVRLNGCRPASSKRPRLPRTISS
ncbi:MAG: RES family NAD+ phosphorylase [Acidobacteria bacterium]|nr:RES family NAD+ phosphorylase [Acidobacteriota bacterium]